MFVQSRKLVHLSASFFEAKASKTTRIAKILSKFGQIKADHIK